jgi:hypothetical protein
MNAIVPTYEPEAAKTERLNGRGMGRIHMPDARDYRHMMAMPHTLPPVMAKTWRSGGAAWDQGNTPQCVAYSGARLLLASPVINDFPTADGDNWQTVYDWCKLNDEWPGEDYDGTSVRAFMKWAQAKGYIAGYEWAFDNLPIINHLAAVGPVQVGTDWTVDMFEPDARHFIRVAPNGDYRVAGGHAYPLMGFDRRKKCPDGSKGAYVMLNSWGPGWGDKGRAWISFADFSILLRNQGEAAVAVETQKKRKRKAA